MARSFEPPDPVPASLLDRRTADRADAELLQRWWRHPRARIVAVRNAEVAVAQPGGSAESVGEPHPALRGAGQRLLLGVDPAGRPWWLVLDVPDHGDVQWLPLRSIGPLLSPLQLEAVMTAAAVEGWHARHRFCPACGAPTEPVLGGWVRRCQRDGTEHYPRTDPAVIVLVIDEADRALLARQGSWPAAWRSALAGFIEPGEAAESAVRREVAEEVGLVLDRVRYLTSQPWPFPGSLMLGFHAWTSSVDISVDGAEIVEADWYSRAELLAAAESGRIALPPAISIARRLIERWYGQPLPGSWLRT